jgi:hypothetical protein
MNIALRDSLLMATIVLRVLLELSAQRMLCHAQHVQLTHSPARERAHAHRVRLELPLIP